MKKIREEIIEYYYDEESGRVVKKIQENRLLSEENGKEQWQKTYISVPIVWMEYVVKSTNSEWVTP